ncbi:MAG: phage holin family protein [Chloroflexi bacterium]|nr:MAG: phage holin family protein [Chloroflexota bacterium]
MHERKAEPSLGELFATLASNTTTLVRQEINLARIEMAQKVPGLAKDLGRLAVGAAVAYAGFLVLLAALVLALGELMPISLSALLVGIVVLGVGFLLLRNGRDALKQADLAPRETLETLKEDTAWAKEQTR